MAAPLDIDCHSCRTKRGIACRTAEGSPTDPHAVRVALSAACEVCRARVGAPCPSAPGGALYHPERLYKARGITGPNFKRELQRHLEQLATFLRGCPAEVSEAHVSVKVRGEANLPRLFGDSGPPIVTSHGGKVDVYVQVAEEAHTPRRPDPRPTGGGGLHRDDARPGRRRPAASYTAEFYDEEHQLEPPLDEDDDDQRPALPPAPPAPGPILLGPSSLPRELPAAPARLALPPPGQQPLFLSLKR